MWTWISGANSCLNHFLSRCCNTNQSSAGSVVFTAFRIVQPMSQIVHTQSYDGTPVSTGGDSGFSIQSWSSLSRKSMYESQQQISSVMNPVSNSMSYSEVSLAESPVDLTSQLQRFWSDVKFSNPCILLSSAVKHTTLFEE